MHHHCSVAGGPHRFQPDLWRRPNRVTVRDAPRLSPTTRYPIETAPWPLVAFPFLHLARTRRLLCPCHRHGPPVRPLAADVITEKMSKISPEPVGLVAKSCSTSLDSVVRYRVYTAHRR